MAMREMENNAEKGGQSPTASVDPVTVAKLDTRKRVSFKDKKIIIIFQIDSTSMWSKPDASHRRSPSWKMVWSAMMPRETPMSLNTGINIESVP